MKTLFIILISVFIYLLMTFLTTILAMYADRKNGNSAKEVYDDFYDYIFCVGIWWPIMFPIVLIYLLSKKFKIWAITIIEILITKEEVDK